MLTWNVVCDHLGTIYRCTQESPHFLCLTWLVAEGAGAAPGAAIAQTVSVQMLEAFDEPWLLFQTPVSEMVIEQRAALERNARLAIGALALEGGQYVLRHAAPLRIMDLSEVERVLRFLGIEASRLQQRPTLSANELPDYASHWV